MLRLCSSLLLSLLIAWSGARALPITFDEAQSAPVKPFFTYRDFPDSLSFFPALGAFSIGTVDFGTNTIMGSLHGDCVVIGPRAECNSTLGQDEQDSFVFTLPVSAAISISVTTLGSGPDGFVPQFSLLRQSSSQFQRLARLPLNDDAVVVSETLPADLYDITLVGRTANAGGPYSFAYSIAIVVPEPSTGLLVTFGLLGLAGWRRGRA